jgi:hypothetical protein
MYILTPSPLPSKIIVKRVFAETERFFSTLLGLLYFYAVIQPMAAAFPDNPAVHLLATTVALPLKVLLWLVCVWAF